jgi:hypothetical protein
VLTPANISDVIASILRRSGSAQSDSDLFATISSFTQTAAELAASVTPVNYAYAPGDVRRYGAAGDGVTDDSIAIQNAIKVGGTITFQSATYYMAGINLNKNVILQGQGADATTLLTKLAGVGSQYSANMFTDTAALNSVIFKDLTLNGAASAVASQSNAWNVALVQLTQTSKIRFENVTVTGYAASGASLPAAITGQFIQALTLYNATQVDLINVISTQNYFPCIEVYFAPGVGICTVDRCKQVNATNGTAIQTFLEINGGRAVVTNCQLQNGRGSTSAGDSWINFNACISMHISGCTFELDDTTPNNGIGINCGQSLFPYNNNITIEGNKFINVGQPISVGPGRNVVIRDNIIQHAQLLPIFVQANSTTGFATYNALFPAYPAGAFLQSQNLTITGNKIYGIATSANAAAIFVSDDTTNGAYGWQNITITNNEVMMDPTSNYSFGLISYAIRLRDVAHVMIADNKQLNYGAYGIYSDGTVNDLTVRGNTFIPLNYLSGAAQSLDDIYFTGFAPQSLWVRDNTFAAYPPGPSTYNVHFAGGDPAGCLIEDNIGMKQSFPVFVATSTTSFVIRNTKGQRTSGAPSIGNFGIGDVIFTIPANTAPVEYDCTAAGSFAVLVGVTVTYVSGNSFCTQTAGTTLAPGMRISIVNGAGGGSPLTACVLFVSGTTIFIDNTFGSTQPTGQACTIVNPTFHAAGAYTT